MAKPTKRRTDNTPIYFVTRQADHADFHGKKH